VTLPETFTIADAERIGARLPAEAEERLVDLVKKGQPAQSYVVAYREDVFFLLRCLKAMEKRN
jgi:hypothetical protein